MAERPAATLLHLGPGPRQRARQPAQRPEGELAPIVNIVGEHATYHMQHDAPLTSDIEGIARPVSALGADLAERRRAVAADGAAAIAAARDAARADRDADPAGRHRLGRG